MSTTDGAIRTGLPGLVPEVDTFLAEDRLAQIKVQAAQFIAKVAEGYIRQDEEARLPEAEERWSAWQTGIVSPLLQAAPQSMALHDPRYAEGRFAINLSVPIPNHGVTTPLPIELSLFPSANSAKDKAIDAYLLLQGIQDLRRRYPGSQRLTSPNPNTVVLANQAGCAVSTMEQGRTKWLRKPIHVPFVELDKLGEAADAKWKAAFGGIAVDGVGFSLGSHRYGGTDTRVRGAVIKPAISRVTPYVNYDSAHSKEVQSVVEALEPEALEQAAWEKLDTGEVYERIESKATEAVAEFVRKQQVVDEVYKIVTQSDAFKRLIAA